MMDLCLSKLLWELGSLSLLDIGRVELREENRVIDVELQWPVHRETDNEIWCNDIFIRA